MYSLFNLLGRFFPVFWHTSTKDDAKNIILKGSATVSCYAVDMPRITRVDIADHVYHVLNRANARVQIFDTPADYDAFERILEEAIEKFSMRLLAYCIMPNHWHLVVYPRQDGDLSRFMSWLTNTHTRRWHTAKHTIGQGHLYQGRYKSFICQQDQHFLNLCRYVERNAKKANLSLKAEDWRWGSAWRRANGTEDHKKILSEWPVPFPERYSGWLNEPQTISEEEAFERAIVRSNPLGNDAWTKDIVKRYGIEQTLRPTGRPKNGG
jgi:putative transposase